LNYTRAGPDYCRACDCYAIRAEPECPGGLALSVSTVRIDPAIVPGASSVHKYLLAGFLCLAPVFQCVVAAEWTPILSPRDQIFPALVLATANLPDSPSRNTRVIGDSNGLIGVRMRAERDGQKVRIGVELPGWLRPSYIEAELPTAGKRYSIFPTLAWDFDRLRSLRQPLPETINFSVRIGTGAVEERSLRVRMRSINDAPYFISNQKSSTDLSWMFAAYVDEDHPRVTSILSDALALRVVKRFDGYQSRDPKLVLKQVFAIWYALQRRGIHYSSITRTGNSNGEVLAQHVRFLDESWQNNQANCVDGSVLLASVLRKIDLNPSLVLVPGHMLLAFELSPGGERAYLETTRLDSLQPGKNGKLDENASFKSFTEATRRGYATYQAAARNFGDASKPEYQIIDIGAARALGVVPIGAR